MRALYWLILMIIGLWTFNAVVTSDPCHDVSAMYWNNPRCNETVWGVR